MGIKSSSEKELGFLLEVKNQHKSPTQGRILPPSKLEKDGNLEVKPKIQWYI